MNGRALALASVAGLAVAGLAARRGSASRMRPVSLPMLQALVEDVRANLTNDGARSPMGLCGDASSYLWDVLHQRIPDLAIVRGRLLVDGEPVAHFWCESKALDVIIDAMNPTTSEVLFPLSDAYYVPTQRRTLSRANLQALRDEYEGLSFDDARYRKWPISARDGSAAVETVQPGDTVHFLLGWDKKKHPVVTGTVLHPYAMGERGDWIVRYATADGKPNEVAVSIRSMHPGPAPEPVIPFRPRSSTDRERAVLVPSAKPDWSGREIGLVPDAWFTFFHLTGDIRVSRDVSCIGGDVYASWKVIKPSGPQGANRTGQDFFGLLTGNEIAARDTLPHCQKALDALRAQTGAPIRGLFHVGSLELNRPYRGRGIARALYRDMVTVAAGHGLAVAPGACYRDADHPHLGRGSTTPAAQRIWEDLAREYPHVRARTRLLLWGGT